MINLLIARKAVNYKLPCKDLDFQREAGLPDDLSTWPRNSLEKALIHGVN
jgi:hypothetical protein